MWETDSIWHHRYSIVLVFVVVVVVVIHFHFHFHYHVSIIIAAAAVIIAAVATILEWKEKNRYKQIANRLDYTLPYNY